MGKYFSQFIPCLVVMTIIEFISPENSKRKQVQLAASIMFVIMMFVPVLEYIFKSDFSEILLQTEYELESVYVETSMQEQNLGSFYNDSLKAEYENRLYESLNNYMAAKGFDMENKYKIFYENDPKSENFGIIKSIKLDADNFDENETKKIKKLISDFYMLDIENINIEETGSEVNT